MVIKDSAYTVVGFPSQDEINDSLDNSTGDLPLYVPFAVHPLADADGLMITMITLCGKRRRDTDRGTVWHINGLTQEGHACEGYFVPEGSARDLGTLIVHQEVRMRTPSAADARPSLKVVHSRAS